MKGRSGFHGVGYLIYVIIVLLLLVSCDNIPKKVVKKKISKSRIINISFDLRRTVEEDALSYLSLIKYLENKTGYSFKLILPGQTKYKDNYPLNEHIDIAIVGAATAIKGIENKWHVILRGYTEDMELEYRSVLITPIISDINSINDIKGKNIAFGDYYSTQGHLIPRIEMEKLDITLKELSSFIYTSSHHNCIHGVYKGEYDAGFVQDILAEKRAEQNIIKIVWYSDYYPISCIILSPFLNDTITSAIKEALLELKPLSNDSLILYKWDETEMAGGFTDGCNDDYRELLEWAIKLNILK